MKILGDAFYWLTDPSNWLGDPSIISRIIEHILLSVAVVAVAFLIAFPIGVVIGHTRKGAGIVGAVTGGARAIPTLGLLTVLGLSIGIGVLAPSLALVILAIPSLLAGTYSGVSAIEPTIPSAAKAIGMSTFQVVCRVELPLASPVIIGGLRAATLQVIATATLAAYTADIGLGRYLFAGLKSRDYAQMLGAAILVILLALLAELTLAAIQYFARCKADPARK